jgi:periplasmic divalent cation tolerance protein
MSEAALLILCNAPDAATAGRIARSLVERRLAACVNVMPACQSVYRWQGQIEEASEVPLMIKTSAARYAAVEAAIRELHPYEVPEIIALPIAAGLPAYLDWLNQETA